MVGWGWYQERQRESELKLERRGSAFCRVSSKLRHSPTIRFGLSPGIWQKQQFRVSVFTECPQLGNKKLWHHAEVLD